MRKWLFTLLFLFSCTQEQRKPAQTAPENLAKNFSSCLKKLNSGLEHLDRGQFPFGQDEGAIVEVDRSEIPGREENYLHYRYLKDSPERDEASSEIFLFITDEKIQKFVVPYFEENNSMGRLKFKNNFYYYTLNFATVPECFYDSHGKVINEQEDAPLKCDVFSRERFSKHNAEVKRNPLVSVDADGNTYTSFKDLTPQDETWVQFPLERTLESAAHDLVINVLKYWARAVSKAEQSQEYVGVPETQDIAPLLASQECEAFPGVKEQLKDLNEKVAFQKRLLGHYNQN